MYPVAGQGWQETGPSGYTYAAVLVRLDGPALLAALREVRFSGWLAPAGDDGWSVAVAASGAGTTAAGRRGVIGVGEWLAERSALPVFVVRVVDDRQLVLALWTDGEERGRYVSDPSWGLDDRDGVLSEPVGAGYADAFAAGCARPDAGDDLAELLAEELDVDSVIESERLAGVLRLLGLPRWVVAAASPPREIVGGPPKPVRLGAGRTGPAGRIAGWAVGHVRRHRPPPPVLDDPPRGAAGHDPWLF